MAHFNRIDEDTVAEAVEKYLKDVGGIAPIRQIRRALPRYVDLSPADRAKSKTRNREELWEQQVRNVVCHRHCEGNAVKSGRLIYTRGHLRLCNNPQGSLFD